MDQPNSFFGGTEGPSFVISLYTAQIQPRIQCASISEVRRLTLHLDGSSTRAMTHKGVSGIFFYAGHGLGDMAPLCTEFCRRTCTATQAIRPYRVCRLTSKLSSLPEQVLAYVCRRQTVGVHSTARAVQRSRGTTCSKRRFRVHELPAATAQKIMRDDQKVVHDELVQGRWLSFALPQRVARTRRSGR